MLYTHTYTHTHIYIHIYRILHIFIFIIQYYTFIRKGIWERYLSYDEFFFSLFSFLEKRNVRGDDRLYVGMGNSGYNFVKGLYVNGVGFETETSIRIDGMTGLVLLAEDCVGDGATLLSPIDGLPVRNNKVYW